METRGGEELFEGDMKFAPGQARGSVPGRLWPGGVFVYDIESSLSESEYEYSVNVHNMFFLYQFCKTSCYCNKSHCYGLNLYMHTFTSLLFR